MSRYFSFQQLATIHEYTDRDVRFTVTHHEDFRVVKAPHSDEVIVREGDKIGCSNRRAWLVAAMESHTDPISRFLAAMKPFPLPKNILVTSPLQTYAPVIDERHVSGTFEEVAESGKRFSLQGADAIVILKRDDCLPPFTRLIFVREDLEARQKAALIPWIEEIIVTRQYLSVYGARMADAYYLARSICLRSGIRWDYEGSYQTGTAPPFVSRDGQKYTINAYRDFGRTGGTQWSWIPQICRLQDGWSCPQSLAVSLESNLIAEWVFAIGVESICNDCGTRTSESGQIILCPVCYPT